MKPPNLPLLLEHVWHVPDATRTTEGERRQAIATAGPDLLGSIRATSIRGAVDHVSKSAAGGHCWLPVESLEGLERRAVLGRCRLLRGGIRHPLGAHDLARDLLALGVQLISVVVKLPEADRPVNQKSSQVRDSELQFPIQADNVRRIMSAFVLNLSLPTGRPGFVQS